MTTTAATNPIEPIGPIECAPWCEDGDGHPDVVHPGDRYCTRHAAPVVLALSEPYRTEDGKWWLGYVSVRIDQDPGQQPVIVLVEEDLAPRGIRFTADEARQLRASLDELLTTLDKAAADNAGPLTQRLAGR